MVLFFQCILYIDQFRQCNDDLLNFRSIKTFLFPIERHLLQATNWDHLLKEGLSPYIEGCLNKIHHMFRDTVSIFPLCQPGSWLTSASV